jgi:hypothetical protein
MAAMRETTTNPVKFLKDIRDHIGGASFGCREASYMLGRVDDEDVEKLATAGGKTSAEIAGALAAAGESLKAASASLAVRMALNEVSPPEEDDEEDERKSAGVGRIGDNDAIGTIARQRRRLAPNLGRLGGDLHSLERPVHPPGAVHVGQRLGELLRIGKRCSAHRLGLTVRFRRF